MLRAPNVLSRGARDRRDNHIGTPGERVAIDVTQFWLGKDCPKAHLSAASSEHQVLCSIATASVIFAIMGITEPALYRHQHEVQASVRGGM